MTKKENITIKTDGELTQALLEAREKLRAERFTAAGARAKNPNAPRRFRKTIARILTEQRARVLKAH